MYIPIIELESNFKTGWIGDDLSEPKIKVTHMQNTNPFETELKWSDKKDAGKLLTTKQPYNWYHAHGLPDPANGDEVLAYRIQEEKKRREAKEEVFWQDVVVPNVVAEESIFKMEPGFHTNDFEGVVPQCIAEPSDIKIGFR